MPGSPPISFYISDITDLDNYQLGQRNRALSCNDPRGDGAMPETNFVLCTCGIEFAAPKGMLRCSACQAMRAEFFVAANSRSSPKEAA